MRKKLLTGFMVSIAILLFASACEKDVSAPPYAATLDAYYLESTHLGAATADSISSFTSKVNDLTVAWPEVKEERKYHQIVENIRQSLIIFNITIDGEWDAINEFSF